MPGCSRRNCGTSGDKCKRPKAIGTLRRSRPCGWLCRPPAWSSPAGRRRRKNCPRWNCAHSISCALPAFCYRCCWPWRWRKFYLTLPLLCLLLGRTWMLALVCLGLVIAGPLYRAANLNNEIFYLYGYFACIDAIAIGCLAALLSHRVTLSDRTAAGLRLLAALSISAVYLQGIDGHQIAGFSLLALTSACWLIGSAHASSPGIWRLRLSAPLRWLGRRSYELYLFHIIVLALLRNLVNKDQLSFATGLPWLAVFLLLSMLTATLVARLVTDPANAALRRRGLDARGYRRIEIAR
nr:acyltransferase [Chromobacterium sphagni]